MDGEKVGGPGRGAEPAIIIRTGRLPQNQPHRAQLGGARQATQSPQTVPSASTWHHVALPDQQWKRGPAWRGAAQRGSDARERRGNRTDVDLMKCTPIRKRCTTDRRFEVVARYVTATVAGGRASRATAALGAGWTDERCHADEGQIALALHAPPKTPGFEAAFALVRAIIGS